jgi:hypothetical protein
MSVEENDRPPLGHYHWAMAAAGAFALLVLAALVRSQFG